MRSRVGRRHRGRYTAAACIETNGGSGQFEALIRRADEKRGELVPFRRHVARRPEDAAGDGREYAFHAGEGRSVQRVGVVAPRVKSGFADGARQDEIAEFDRAGVEPAGCDHGFAVERELEILPRLAADAAAFAGDLHLREDWSVGATGAEVRLGGRLDLLEGLVVHDAQASVAAMAVDAVDARDDLRAVARQHEPALLCDDLPFLRQFDLKRGEASQALDGAFERDLHGQRGARAVVDGEGGAGEVGQAGGQCRGVGAVPETAVVGKAFQDAVHDGAKGQVVGRQGIVRQRRHLQPVFQVEAERATEVVLEKGGGKGGGRSFRCKLRRIGSACW